MPNSPYDFDFTNPDYLNLVQGLNTDPVGPDRDPYDLLLDQVFADPTRQNPAGLHDPSVPGRVSADATEDEIKAIVDEHLAARAGNEEYFETDPDWKDQSLRAQGLSAMDADERSSQVEMDKLAGLVPGGRGKWNAKGWPITEWDDPAAGGAWSGPYGPSPNATISEENLRVNEQLKGEAETKRNQRAGLVSLYDDLQAGGVDPLEHFADDERLIVEKEVQRRNDIAAQRSGVTVFGGNGTSAAHYKQQGREEYGKLIDLWTDKYNAADPKDQDQLLREHPSITMEPESAVSKMNSKQMEKDRTTIAELESVTKDVTTTETIDGKKIRSTSKGRPLTPLEERTLRRAKLRLERMEGNREDREAFYLQRLKGQIERSGRTAKPAVATTSGVSSPSSSPSPSPSTGSKPAPVDPSTVTTYSPDMVDTRENLYPETVDPDLMIEAEIVEEEEKAAATEQDVQDFARVQNDPAFAVEVVAGVNQLNSQYVENYPQRPGYNDPNFLDENWDPSSGVRPQQLDRTWTEVVHDRLPGHPPWAALGRHLFSSESGAD
jgi:hypothetical protein